MQFPYSLIDLTHILSEDSPSWNGGCGFKSETKLDYHECHTDVKFKVQQFKMHAGISTHMDAPAHCYLIGRTIEQIALPQLVAPCIVLDVAHNCHERYSVSIEDITVFENKYAPINYGTFVMIKTGWERFWHYPDQYRNNHIFPSVSKEAAAMLITRGVCGIGIDTLSPDRPEDGFHVHRLFLGADKYIIENAANLNELPITGSFIMAIPIKVKGATEAPIRLIGLINKA